MDQEDSQVYYADSSQSISSTESHSLPGAGTGGLYKWEMNALLLGRKREGREFFLCLLLLNCFQVK